MFEWGDVATIGVLIVLEGLLSADNAMVMAVMVLGLPAKEHHKALQYGLIGAFVFRIITTLTAFWLIRLAFAKVIGGLYLLYLPYQHFWGSGESTEQRREPPKAKPWLGLTAFWATVVRVELMNLVFSIDSILAAVAMSPKIRVVLAGGILGIVAMRIVVGRLLALIQKFPAIVDGAFIIIAWVGSKLLVEYLHAEGYIPRRDSAVVFVDRDCRHLRGLAFLRPERSGSSSRSTPGRHYGRRRRERVCRYRCLSGPMS